MYNNNTLIMLLVQDYILLKSTNRANTDAEVASNNNQQIRTPPLQQHL